VPSLVGNRGRFAQIVTNLLVNAAHAIDDAPAANDHEIVVRTREHEGGVLLTVEDSGPGVPHDLRDRIFEPLFTTKTPAKGTGLGLTIVAQLVHGYGGFVRVADGTLRGACFEVWSPVRAHAARPAPVVAATRAPSAERARVLVVDDEPAILRALEGVLGALGHEVTVAAGGSQALAVLRSDVAFDAVLCDVHMPEVDGIALHAWLRGHHPALADRTIFLMADALTDRARQFIATVEPVVVTKPISMPELERAIAALLPK
jgi:two-component system NtrC family sensor kinase